MNERYDWLLMILLGVVIALLIGYRLNRWLMSPSPDRLPGIPINEHIPDHPAIGMLEQEGYDVVGGKVKINLSFETGHRPILSRLFIDYIASDDSGELYMVKLARERMPVDWTGSGIRDRLMPFLLLYPECAGLLYIDVNEKSIHRLSMDWSDEEWIGQDDYNS
ncbi:hypothetical protein AK95_17850 [Paenibacillus sp. LC231]|uniref:hypothetical protein n=1 Tax=unclassified Paenibacillus TaxID=185978 RepID=UPI0008DDC788|nr:MULTISPECIES: hypothetical protein [unclassified Paenibacillus]MCT1397464.1 hypothetical protein [Paenibacillus sp. p3-SID867]OIA99021.1 hypothetical protein AK95_17850 [Paenibacillus sp. LC231]